MAGKHPGQKPEMRVRTLARRDQRDRRADGLSFGRSEQGRRRRVPGDDLRILGRNEDGGIHRGVENEPEPGELDGDRGAFRRTVAPRILQVSVNHATNYRARRRGSEA